MLSKLPDFVVVVVRYNYKVPQKRQLARSCSGSRLVMPDSGLKWNMRGFDWRMFRSL